MAKPVELPSPGVDPAAPAQRHGSLQPAQAQPSRARPAPIGPQESDVRLIIEKQGDTGRYVYTVLDKASGRVIAQIPSADVLKLMSEDAYAAGSLFKTKA